jgi:hypothetical protein
MSPGFYVIESLKEPGKWTVVEVDCSMHSPVVWIGGDQSSSLEELKAQFKVVRQIYLVPPVKQQRVCPACALYGHKGIPATQNRHSEHFDGDCDVCGGYSLRSL